MSHLTPVWRMASMPSCIVLPEVTESSTISTLIDFNKSGRRLTFVLNQNSFLANRSGVVSGLPNFKAIILAISIPLLGIPTIMSYWAGNDFNHSDVQIKASSSVTKRNFSLAIKFLIYLARIYILFKFLFSAS